MVWVCFFFVLTFAAAYPFISDFAIFPVNSRPIAGAIKRMRTFFVIIRGALFFYCVYLQKLTDADIAARLEKY